MDSNGALIYLIATFNPSAIHFAFTLIIFFAYIRNYKDGGNLNTLAHVFMLDWPYSGQSVYVSGSVSGLGTWVAASAIKLNPTSYPTWTGSIQLPANSSIQWKCLKREEANAANGNVWQGGANNVLSTGTGTSVSASF